MLVDLNIEKKYIDIWLASGEDFPALNLLCAQYRDFDIAVIRSGPGSLPDLTAKLLQENL